MTRRPSCNALALVALLSLSSCKDDSSDWCDQCTLEARVDAVASVGSTDCGVAELDAGMEVAECVAAELGANRPFTVVLERAGVDSIARGAWAMSADGTLYRFFYDSNICGGGNGCDEDCGPRVERSECTGPRIDETLPDLIVCETRGEWQTLCEPPRPR